MVVAEGSFVFLLSAAGRENGKSKAKGGGECGLGNGEVGGCCRESWVLNSLGKHVGGGERWR